jgi:hypothetical protein
MHVTAKLTTLPEFSLQEELLLSLPYFSTTNFGQSEWNGKGQMDIWLLYIWMKSLKRNDLQTKSYGRGVIIMQSFYSRPTKNIFIFSVSFVAKKPST